jgi:hypothetical protein
MRFAMRRFVVTATLSFGLLFAEESFCQSGAVTPQSGAGHAAAASCVILKRMGPADEVTSRLYSFGFRGKQFQYVEGKLPEGFPFHGRLTDHDVRNLQARGTEVLVLEPHYTSAELMQARADCRAETGTTPIQAEAKAAPSQTLTGVTTPSTPAVKAEPAKSDSQAAAPPPTQAVLQATLEITSAPPGADIEMDSKFVGNTPSSVSVAAGEHTVKLTLDGYATWERKITTTAASSVRISPKLEALAATPAK